MYTAALGMVQVIETAGVVSGFLTSIVQSDMCWSGEFAIYMRDFRLVAQP